MRKKFKIVDSDTLLLEDGQIIKFNTNEFELIYKNKTLCVRVSQFILLYATRLKFSEQEMRKLKKLIRVVAKVKLKCELRKK